MTISEFKEAVDHCHDIELTAEGKAYTLFTWDEIPFVLCEQYKRGEPEKPKYKANTFDELLSIQLDNGTTLRELIPHITKFVCY